MVTFAILLSVIASSQLTFLISHRWRLTPVRSSALLTLCFVALTAPVTFSLKETLWAAWLGGSFIGMSERDLFRARDLFFAAFIFTGFFLFVLPMNVGIGGALGFAAFVSCGVIRQSLKVVQKLST